MFEYTGKSVSVTAMLDILDDTSDHMGASNQILVQDVADLRGTVRYSCRRRRGTLAGLCSAVLTCSLMSWSCCCSFCTSALTLVLSLSLCSAGMFPLAARTQQHRGMLREKGDSGTGPRDYIH